MFHQDFVKSHISVQIRFCQKGTEYKSTCYVLLSVACISSVLCIFELCTCSSSLICCFFNTFVCILPCVTNIILKDTLIKGVIWDIFSFRIVFRNIKSTTQLRFVISTIYVCKGCLGFFYCVVLPIICTIWNNYYRMISCQYISYYFDMYYMYYMYSSLPFDNNWILSQLYYANVDSNYSLYTIANIFYIIREVGFNSFYCWLHRSGPFCTTFHKIFYAKVLRCWELTTKKNQVIKVSFLLKR